MDIVTRGGEHEGVPPGEWSAAEGDGERGFERRGAGSRDGRTLEAEHDRESCVDVAELTRAQPADRLAQTFGADGGRLLDEHARRRSC